MFYYAVTILPSRTERVSRLSPGMRNATQRKRNGKALKLANTSPTHTHLITTLRSEHRRQGVSGEHDTRTGKIGVIKLSPCFLPHNKTPNGTLNTGKVELRILCKPWAL
jgi:hypothetical protein